MVEVFQHREGDEMISHELWIIAIASLVALSCSLVGVFLVLRKMSMLGDAISHSVLLGIVLAFLLSGGRSLPAMMFGAGAVGLLTAYLTSVFHNTGRLQEDASIGVAFTWLFALGVILISLFAGQVDLDQDCVLYGEIAFAPFDTISLAGQDIGPRAFWTLLLVAALNTAFIVVGYRRLKTVSFDPVLASSLGISLTLWHYLLMTFVSLTTVASFESVGAILVVAMLVIPPNTAYLFARSLEEMIGWSVFFAIGSAIGGYLLARHFDASISGAMATVSGVLFIFVHVFVGPESLIAQIRRNKGVALTPPALPD